MVMISGEWLCFPENGHDFWRMVMFPGKWS